MSGVPIQRTTQVPTKSVAQSVVAETSPGAVQDQLRIQFPLSNLPPISQEPLPTKPPAAEPETVHSIPLQTPVSYQSPSLLLSDYSQTSLICDEVEVDLQTIDNHYPGVAQRLSETESKAAQFGYESGLFRSLEMQVLKDPPWTPGSTPNSRQNIQAKAAELRSLNPELDSADPKSYDFVKAMYQAESLMENLTEKFSGDQFPDVKIAARAKAPASLSNKLEKMTARDPDFKLSHLTDTVGARVDCPDLKTLGNVARSLEKMYDGKVVAKNDYLSEPGENSYRALHFIVDMGDRMAEIQITTHRLRACDQASHDTVYKPMIPVTEKTKEMLSTAGDRAMFVECLELMGAT